MLAGIAEFERELIRECTGEDRKRGPANGVKFGRKRKRGDYQRSEAIKRATLARIEEPWRRPQPELSARRELERWVSTPWPLIE